MKLLNTVLALLASALVSNAAVVFPFVLFNGPDVGLVATATADQDGNDLTVRIDNTSVNDLEMTRLFFETTLAVTIDTQGPGVSFHADNNQNLPGGNAINWLDNGDQAFVADPPPTTNGLSPGEFIVFRVDDFFVGENSLRVAAHVQQSPLGSAGYVTTTVTTNQVPEPSVALLGGLGVLALLRRKRTA